MTVCHLLVNMDHVKIFPMDIRVSKKAKEPKHDRQILGRATYVRGGLALILINYII
jgi:hypothetical protein